MIKFRDKIISLVIIICFLSASTSAETLRLPLAFVENKEDEQTETSLFGERGPLGLNLFKGEKGFRETEGIFIIDYDYVNSYEKFQEPIIHMCEMLKQLRERNPEAHKGEIWIVAYEDGEPINEELKQKFLEYKDFVRFFDAPEYQQEYNKVRENSGNVFAIVKKDTKLEIYYRNFTIDDAHARETYGYNQHLDILALFRLHIECQNYKLGDRYKASYKNEISELFHDLNILIIDERKHLEIMDLIKLAGEQKKIIDDI
ncbi:MAG: hypothetical protein P9L93_00765 [Candidatus Gorgyraea atricola]|nr:hypothetical protein [Candidatus Gorgyraea atricola]